MGRDDEAGRTAQASEQPPEEDLAQVRRRHQELIAHSQHGIWRLELRRPMPVSLPQLEQVEWILDHSYFAECNEEMARMYEYPSPRALTTVPGRQVFEALWPNVTTQLLAWVRNNYRADRRERRDRTLHGRPL